MASNMGIKHHRIGVSLLAPCLIINNGVFYILFSGGEDFTENEFNAQVLRISYLR